MCTTKLIEAWRARPHLTQGSTWWWMLEREDLQQLPLLKFPPQAAVLIGTDLKDVQDFYTCEEDALADLLRAH